MKTSSRLGSAETTPRAPHERRGEATQAFAHRDLGGDSSATAHDIGRGEDHGGEPNGNAFADARGEAHERVAAGPNAPEVSEAGEGAGFAPARDKVGQASGTGTTGFAVELARVVAASDSAAASVRYSGAPAGTPVAPEQQALDDGISPRAAMATAPGLKAAEVVAWNTGGKPQATTLTQRPRSERTPTFVDDHSLQNAVSGEASMDGLAVAFERSADSVEAQPSHGPHQGEGEIASPDLVQGNPVATLVTSTETSRSASPQPIATSTRTRSPAADAAANDAPMSTSKAPDLSAATSSKASTSGPSPVVSGKTLLSTASKSSPSPVAPAVASPRGLRGVVPAADGFGAVPTGRRSAVESLTMADTTPTLAPRLLVPERRTAAQSSVPQAQHAPTVAPQAVHAPAVAPQATPVLPRTLARQASPALPASQVVPAHPATASKDRRVPPVADHQDVSAAALSSPSPFELPRATVVDPRTAPIQTSRSAPPLVTTSTPPLVSSSASRPGGVADETTAELGMTHAWTENRGELAAPAPSLSSSVQRSRTASSPGADAPAPFVATTDPTTKPVKVTSQSLEVEHASRRPSHVAATPATAQRPPARTARPETAAGLEGPSTAASAPSVPLVTASPDDVPSTAVPRSQDSAPQSGRARLPALIPSDQGLRIASFQPFASPAHPTPADTNALPPPPAIPASHGFESRRVRAAVLDLVQRSVPEGSLASSASRKDIDTRSAFDKAQSLPARRASIPVGNDSTSSQSTGISATPSQRADAAAPSQGREQGHPGQRRAGRDEVASSRRAGAPPFAEGAPVASFVAGIAIAPERVSARPSAKTAGDARPAIADVPARSSRTPSSDVAVDSSESSRTEKRSVGADAPRATVDAAPSRLAPPPVAHAPTPAASREPRVSDLQVSAGPAAPVSLLDQAAADPSLHAAAIGNNAHLHLDAGSAGSLSVHLRMRDGVADLEVEGTAASSLDIRPQDLRRALAGEGIALGRFESRTHESETGRVFESTPVVSAADHNASTGSEHANQKMHDNSPPPPSSPSEGPRGMSASFASPNGSSSFGEGRRNWNQDSADGNDRGPRSPADAGSSSSAPSGSAPRRRRGFHVMA